MKKFSKLIIQIPAYNEEDLIENAIGDIPCQIRGFSNVEISVINDGSTDKTLEKATKCKVHHILDLDHGGLGKTFREGLKVALQAGADVVVNFDADMQYCGNEIENLVLPILEEKADMVIGNRQLSKIKGYPPFKLFTQTFWNFLINSLFHVKIKDATSGFRAFTKETSEILIDNLKDDYTYSAESIYILAKQKKRIVFVPINIRPTPRKSRLITSKLGYVKKIFATMIKNLSRNA